METSTDKQLQSSVEHIAETLSNPDKFEAEQREAHGDDYDESEHSGPMAWLEDVLDIRYIVNRQGEFVSAQVLVAFGGPNIWVNFDTRAVEGYWWGDRATANFTDELGVEDMLSELWESR